MEDIDIVFDDCRSIDLLSDQNFFGDLINHDKVIVSSGIIYVFSIYPTLSNSNNLTMNDGKMFEFSDEENGEITLSALLQCMCFGYQSMYAQFKKEETIDPAKDKCVSPLYIIKIQYYKDTKIAMPVIKYIGKLS